MGDVRVTPILKGKGCDILGERFKGAAVGVMSISAQIDWGAKKSPWNESSKSQGRRFVGGFKSTKSPRFKSDSQSTLHPVVVAHHQPRQRLRGLPGDYALREAVVGSSYLDQATECK